MTESVTFVYDFIHHGSKTIAYASIQGKLEPRDIKRLYLGLIAFSCTKNTFHLLADFRESSMDFDQTTILDLVKQVGCITSGYRLARIYPRTDFRQYIIEEYADRLSVPIRNFSNKEDAIEWVYQEAP